MSSVCVCAPVSSVLKFVLCFFPLNDITIWHGQYITDTCPDTADAVVLLLLFLLNPDCFSLADDMHFSGFCCKLIYFHRCLVLLEVDDAVAKNGGKLLSITSIVFPLSSSSSTLSSCWARALIKALIWETPLLLIVLYYLDTLKKKKTVKKTLESIGKNTGNYYKREKEGHYYARIRSSYHFIKRRSVCSFTLWSVKQWASPPSLQCMCLSALIFYELRSQENITRLRTPYRLKPSLVGE